MYSKEADDNLDTFWLLKIEPENPTRKTMFKNPTGYLAGKEKTQISIPG